MNKKVFVTGCFDMLHSGHIAFLKEAAAYGDVYIGLGSDANVYNLKGRYPVNSQAERKYMLEALSCVKECLINSGWGIMDFENELQLIKPDYFIVNEDGNSPAKEELANKYGFKYLVLKRIPHDGLPVRSTTSLRTECRIPYRIDLAGGWLDQPFVSTYYPGPVLTISIEPTLEFNERSGMASSTRKKAIELWVNDIPGGDKELQAKILFSYENPPGTRIIAGSQDAIGIVIPGLNKLDYNNNYWPSKITSVYDEGILLWLENHLYMITLEPREQTFNVLNEKFINRENAKKLSDAAENCWNSILKKDLTGFGNGFKESFEAQTLIFPRMLNPEIKNIIEKYKDRALGWKLSGAGGGGYLLLVSEKNIEGAMQIKIRRREQI
ncbi:MAG TPA: adenylyltransferase/cytidyltransferase family protein [Ignavibacteriaceae bacterium]|nr:adenylyltransferase/cytidyltransferase family protein [Ignavibacteriaceae bacterium]